MRARASTCELQLLMRPAARKQCIQESTARWRACHPAGPKLAGRNRESVSNFECFARGRENRGSSKDGREGERVVACVGGLGHNYRGERARARAPKIPPCVRGRHGLWDYSCVLDKQHQAHMGDGSLLSCSRGPQHLTEVHKSPFFVPSLPNI